ncbi:MAG: oligosaccharide flippase family protein [Parcubacteria group bacterium]|nr:oligosaccharide flippase family protein [Parcubacteria group bacterium]
MIRAAFVNFINWLGRKLGTDMPYLLRNGIWINTGYASASVAGLILSVAYANFLSPETYGAYSTVISVTAILAILSLDKMSTPVTRAVAAGYSKTFLESYLCKLRWSFASAGVAFLLAVYYFLVGNVSLGMAFVMVGIFTPVMQPHALYNAYLNGKQNFRLTALLQIITQIIHVIVAASVSYLTDSFLVILFSYFVSHSILRVSSFLYVKTRFKKEIQEAAIDREAITLGRELSFLGSYSVIVSHLDKILLWHFLGPAQVALYAFATAPTKELSRLFNPISTLALPKFSNRSKLVLKQRLLGKIFKIGLFSLPIVVGYILLAPHLFSYLFPQYSAAILLSQIYSLKLLMQGDRLLSPFFHSQMLKKQLYIINIVSPTIKLVSMLCLLPFFGVMGIVISVLVTELIDLIYRLILVKRS